ncbi:MAG: D-alanyl-D-alanine carboxypeptidase family protein [Muricoprocola sp.]
MKCTDRPLTRQEIRNRRRRQERRRMMGFVFFILLILFLVASIIYLIFFRSHEIKFENPYQIEDSTYGVLNMPQQEARAVPLTDGLCVTAEDVTFDGVSVQYAQAGALLDLSEQNVLYAKNIHEQLYPASLTKIMTALVALKYGNLDDVVTIDEAMLDIDPESSVCYLELGDQYTLKQLIYGLLIASGNDAANAIAYHVAGSLEDFVDLMNQEAAALGATKTHFMNPHGLQDENHYTTPYDIYLMFHEAIKYDTFADAINQTSYIVTYQAADGEMYERTWFATNYYFTGEATPPEDVLIFGGKTGTTDEAGACLALLSKDPYGNSFFSIIMKADTKADLYEEMNDLLSIINKKQL